MTLIYPGIGGRPMITAAVKCLLSNKGYYVTMLLDTGSEQSCFPAAFAREFGHDNSHPEVEIVKNAVQGIGGTANAFLHSVQISLLDPIKTKRNKPVIAWTATPEKFSFIENLNCLHGLIGMDIMSSWKSVNFEPNKHGVKIIITL